MPVAAKDHGYILTMCKSLTCRFTLVRLPQVRIALSPYSRFEFTGSFHLLEEEDLEGVEKSRRIGWNFVIESPVHHPLLPCQHTVIIEVMILIVLPASFDQISDRSVIR